MVRFVSELFLKSMIAMSRIANFVLSQCKRPWRYMKKFVKNLKFFYVDLLEHDQNQKKDCFKAEVEFQSWKRKVLEC